MRAISAFAHLMSSTASVAPRTGNDTYGKPTYGTSTTYRAHVARQQRFVRTAEGQQVLSQQALYLATTDQVLLTSQVTLSTGDVGSTEAALIRPTIVAVERRFDAVGGHHSIVYF